MKPAEISIYRLSKGKNLIKPEIKITKTPVSPDEFAKFNTSNKLLEEHISRENDTFDKQESKRAELLKWLEASGNGWH